MHIFMLYRVQPGKMEEYKRYIFEFDQKVWNEEIIGKIPGVKKIYRAYDITGAGKSLDPEKLLEAERPYDVIEDIEVDDIEAFKKILESPAAEKLGPEWRKVVDQESIRTFYAEQFMPQ